MIEYGKFEEKGYTVTVMMPSHGQEPLEWVVTVAKNGAAVREEERVPMLHAPIFGPRASDVTALEQHVELILEQLP